MANMLLTFLLVSNLALLICVIFAFAKIHSLTKQFQDIYQQFQTFISPEAEGKPSPFANMAQMLSEMFSRSIMAQIKTSLMGRQSGLVRGEQAVQGELVDAAIENSSLGGIVSAIPTLGKSLRKNPQLLDLALRFLAKPNQVTTNSGDNGHNAQVKFKL